MSNGNGKRSASAQELLEVLTRLEEKLEAALAEARARRVTLDFRPGRQPLPLGEGQGKGPG
ncbi:MAG: hypothetical protein HYY04_18575 [Chloroflexi bacterium]|nr:hypothetical protein [Chloroflexota bacterium]